MDEGIPTKVSKTKKTKEEMLEHAEPTLNCLHDIDQALAVWAKYWPVLNTDSEALQLEKRIKDKVEYRKHVLGSKTPKNVEFHSNSLEFRKRITSEFEAKFWQVLASN